MKDGCLDRESVVKEYFTTEFFVYYTLTGTGSVLPTTSHHRLKKPTFDAYGVRGYGSPIKIR